MSPLYLHRRIFALTFALAFAVFNAADMAYAQCNNYESSATITLTDLNTYKVFQKSFLSIAPRSVLATTLTSVSPPGPTLRRTRFSY